MISSFNAQGHSKPKAILSLSIQSCPEKPNSSSISKSLQAFP